MKFKTLLAALILVISTCGCGGGGSDDSDADTSTDACSAIGLKIANGESCTANDENPNGSPIVRLQILDLDGGLGICSGTAITTFKVLTAAHCFIDGAQEVRIDHVFGTVVASTVKTHPDFRFERRVNGAATFFNDAAVVTVPSALPIATYPLLTSREPILGEEAVIAGFGETFPDSDIGVLNAGNAFVTSFSSNHVFLQFTANQSHPCVGDSGGPLLLRSGTVLAVAGIVSQSDPSVSLDNSCSEGDITLYANTQQASILSFILTQAPDASVR